MRELFMLKPKNPFPAGYGVTWDGRNKVPVSVRYGRMYPNPRRGSSGVRVESSRRNRRRLGGK